MATWWNNNYLYYKQITVSGGSATVPTAYTISLTFGHAALVTAGKSLSSGDDIRVVYWNGSSNVELDRMIDDESSWNNASTMIRFKTQAAINAGASDNNYYLYYGYSSATSPPTNWANVWFLWDDFGGSLDTTTRWDTGGTPTVTSGELLINANGEYIYAKSGFAFARGYMQESRVKSNSTSNGFYEFNDASSNGVAFSDDFIAQGYYDGGAATLSHCKQTNGGSYAENKTLSVTSTTYHKYSWALGTDPTLKFYLDDSLKYTMTSALPSDNMRTVFTVTTAYSRTGSFYVDWVRVRKWLSSEPTNALGSESEKPAGTNCQTNIGDVWKTIESMKINIGDSWKDVSSASINVGDAWKTIF
jgi:hypothetical protein